MIGTFCELDTCCPICGKPITYSDGIQKCTSCAYQLVVNEIDYTKRSNNLCMICGNPLIQSELKICERCKDEMKKNMERIK